MLNPPGRERSLFLLFNLQLYCTAASLQFVVIVVVVVMVVAVLFICETNNRRKTSLRESVLTDVQCTVFITVYSTLKRY